MRLFNCRLFALLCLLVTCHCAKGQPAYQYVPFPTDAGHHWLMDRLDPRYASSHLHHVYSLGDSIIFGHTYTVLSDGNLIRNDTVRRRIYGVPIGTFQDTLIMSYDLELGDSVPDCWVMCRYPFQNGCQYLASVNPIARIRGIDFIRIGNKLHRRLQCTGYVSGPEGVFIEGIGHGAGVFEKLTPRDYPDSTYFLICFDDNPINPSFRPVCGPLATRVGKLHALLEAYPNPCLAGQMLTLQLPMPLESQAEAMLFDMQGRMVRHVPLIKGALKCQLSMEGLASGQYIAKIAHPSLAAEPIIITKP